MGKFKVGDRVRCVKRYTGAFTVGKEYTVAYYEPAEHRIGVVTADHGDNDGIDASYFELAVAKWEHKVGDRVRSLVSPEKGIGTIVKNEADGFNSYGHTMVKFDNWRMGHNGVDLLGNTGGSHWLIYPSELELVPTVADAGGGFKAGDRIRCIRNPAGEQCLIGDQFVAVARGKGSGFASSVHYTSKDGRKTWRPGEYFELVTAPATFTIESGKFYKTRDGRKVGPIALGTSGPRHWIAPVMDDVYASSWYQDGAFYSGEQFRLDLVAEWGEEPAVTTPVAAVPTAIVAVIEDGVPKPATKPFVHTTAEAATAEAERLALLHAGSEFGVFTLATSRVADIVKETVTRTVLRAA
jgi:hypothetical protein